MYGVLKMTKMKRTQPSPNDLLMKPFFESKEYFQPHELKKYAEGVGLHRCKASFTITYSRKYYDEKWCEQLDRGKYKSLIFKGDQIMDEKEQLYINAITSSLKVMDLADLQTVLALCGEIIVEEGLERRE